MLKLFLLEDDASNRLTLGVLLEEEGFEVEVAASLAEARARLATSDAAFDVFLLDHTLGDGFGSDLIPFLRERFPRGRIVTISGSLGNERAAAEADLAVTKATHFPVLAAQLQKLVQH